MTVPQPTQIRSSNPTQQIKEQKYRVTGLTPAYTIKLSGQGLDGGYLHFRERFIEHGERHGMLPIAYLPDPAEPTRMVSILHFHAKFTIESVRVAVALLQPKWDAYDQANNRDLIQFFFNSLDVKSERLLRENREDGDVTFVVLWMIFQRTTASVSVNRYESLKLSIRTTQPSQFPGQNILHFADVVSRAPGC